MNKKIDCLKCSHFYCNKNESEDCDAQYKEICFRVHRTNPIEFAEQYLGIKLYPWQKLMLKHFDYQKFMEMQNEIQTNN